MKVIVLGMGNFGASIAVKLTELGHDVIGVDTDIHKVNDLKEKITYSVCLDSSNLQSVTTLPIKEVDLAIVAIGEDFGASVMTTALLKQLQVKKLICRAISQVHEAVFNAIGVDEIVHPEQETAERLAYRLHLTGVIDAFTICENMMVVKVQAPEELIGKTIEDVDFKTTQIQLVAILRASLKSNIFGLRTSKLHDIGRFVPETMIEENDELVLYGPWHKLKEFIGE